MAAALCIEQQCQPRDLPVRSLQTALLQDPIAPAAVVPLFNLPPNHPDWRFWQHYYLDHPESYANTGYCPIEPFNSRPIAPSQAFSGRFQRHADQDYSITLSVPSERLGKTLKLVTLDAAIDHHLKGKVSGQILSFSGKLNYSGNWITVETLK